MPRTSFNDIPLPLARIICEHLATSHRPSLYAFALVNKSCYNAAFALLFRRIVLRVTEESRPERSVQQLRQVLERTNGFRFVRHVVLCGFGRWEEEHDQLVENDMQSDACRYPFGNTANEDEENVEPINIARVEAQWQSSWYVDNDVWDMLADFIPDLPGLSDVIFDCSTQYLPRLLRVLHQHHPQCRLHLGSFDIYRPDGSLTPAEQVELITSPLLHTIYLRDRSQEGYGPDGTPTYGADAVRRIIAGLAPNLKKVAVLNTHAGWSPALAEALAQERPAWLGFALPDNETTKRTKGSLDYLQLVSFEPLNDVREWMSCIDDSTLRVLKLERLVSENALKYLATECRFPKLETLVLNMVTTNVSSPLPRSLWSATGNFLLTLPPLLALGLPGTTNSTLLRPVFEHHGASLRTLWLSGETASPKLIKHLVQSCPSICKLGLQIQRSKGDATEVTTYATLGSLPKLQDLSLTLDCSDTRVLAEQEGDDDPDAKLESPNDPSFDEFDQQMLLAQLDYSRYPRRGHVRDAFINCAVDGDLARSIFTAVSLGKDKGASSLLLSRLKISVTGGCNFGTNRSDYILSIVVNELSRSWIVERNPREVRDGAQELTVYECTSKTQQQHPLQRDDLDPEVYKIFQRIWLTNSRDSKSWRKQWHSLPLLSDISLGAGCVENS